MNFLSIFKDTVIWTKIDWKNANASVAFGFLTQNWTLAHH